MEIYVYQIHCLLAVLSYFNGSTKADESQFDFYVLNAMKQDESSFHNTLSFCVTQ